MCGNGSWGPRFETPARRTLLDLDLGALLLEGGLDLLRLLAVDAFLDRLGRCINEVLGLLEAEAGQLANDLDHRDLVRADLGQGRGELRLLFRRGGLATGGSSATGRGRGGNCNGCSRGHTELVLEFLLELGQLEHGHLLERLEQLVCGHGCHRSWVSLRNGTGCRNWVWLAVRRRPPAWPRAQRRARRRRAAARRTARPSWPSVRRMRRLSGTARSRGSAATRGGSRRRRRSR